MLSSSPTVRWALAAPQPRRAGADPDKPGELLLRQLDGLICLLDLAGYRCTDVAAAISAQPNQASQDPPYTRITLDAMQLEEGPAWSALDPEPWARGVSARIGLRLAPRAAWDGQGASPALRLDALGEATMGASSATPGWLFYGLTAPMTQLGELALTPVPPALITDLVGALMQAWADHRAGRGRPTGLIQLLDVEAWVPPYPTAHWLGIEGLRDHLRVLRDADLQGFLEAEGRGDSQMAQELERSEAAYQRALRAAETPQEEDLAWQTHRGSALRAFKARAEHMLRHIEELHQVVDPCARAFLTELGAQPFLPVVFFAQELSLINGLGPAAPLAPSDVEWTTPDLTGIFASAQRGWRHTLQINQAGKHLRCWWLSRRGADRLQTPAELEALEGSGEVRQFQAWAFQGHRTSAMGEPLVFRLTEGDQEVGTLRVGATDPLSLEVDWTERYTLERIERWARLPSEVFAGVAPDQVSGQELLNTHPWHPLELAELGKSFERILAQLQRAIAVVTSSRVEALNEAIALDALVEEELAIYARLNRAPPTRVRRHSEQLPAARMQLRRWMDNLEHAVQDVTLSAWSWLHYVVSRQPSLTPRTQLLFNITPDPTIEAAGLGLPRERWLYRWRLTGRGINTDFLIPVGLGLMRGALEVIHIPDTPEAIESAEPTPDPSWGHHHYDAGFSMVSVGEGLSLTWSMDTGWSKPIESFKPLTPAHFAGYFLMVGPQIGYSAAILTPTTEGFFENWTPSHRLFGWSGGSYTSSWSAMIFTGSYLPFPLCLMDGVVVGSAEGATDFYGTSIGAEIGSTQGLAVHLSSCPAQHAAPIEAPELDEVELRRLTPVQPAPVGDTIFFEVDSAEITEDYKELLRDMVALNRAYLASPSTAVFVDGHASAPGSVAHNQDLSLRRAQATWQFVRDLLGPALKINESSLLFLRAHGEQEADALGEEQENASRRRVTLTINSQLVIAP